MTIRSESEFTAVYREQYQDLLSFVRRRSHPSDVDDIVGETFLTAWRRRQHLPTEVRPWLFRTARNIMLNANRGQNRQEALTVRIGNIGFDAVESEENLGDRIDLQTAWRTLPMADQEAIGLTTWEGLTPGEAASVLGCTRAAFAMRLTRARRHLAELLAVPTPSPCATPDRNAS